MQSVGIHTGITCLPTYLQWEENETGLENAFQTKALCVCRRISCVWQRQKSHVDAYLLSCGSCLDWDANSLTQGGILQSSIGIAYITVSERLSQSDPHKNPVVISFPTILVLKDVNWSTGDCLTPSNNNQKYGSYLTFSQEVYQGCNLWTGQSQGFEYALDFTFWQIRLILIFFSKMSLLCLEPHNLLFLRSSWRDHFPIQNQAMMIIIRV